MYTRSQASSSQYQSSSQNSNTNGRCNNNVDIVSTSSRVNLNQQQSKNDKYQVIPHPNSVNPSFAYPAYKVQKVMIDNQMIFGINMNAYSYSESRSDLLITITDLKDIFFPQTQTLDCCKKVLGALDIQLYKGNR